MKVTNIGSYKSINAFVENKLKVFNEGEESFDRFVELMFSEKENILFEKSVNYKIVKTTYGEAYGEIVRRAGVIKAELSETEYNSVVGLYMSNSVEWIENFWAILMAGYRPLLMNMRLDRETLEDALKTSDAKLVISDDISNGNAFSVRTVSSELAGKEAIENKGRFGTEILVMSSGTGEHVKICAYSASEFSKLVNDSYRIIKKCSLIKKHYEGELKLLTFLPFYHVFGLIAVYIWFSFFSRTFVQLNDMLPDTIVNTIRRHKVTHIFAVPMFWNKVYEQAIRTIKGRGDETWAKFDKGLALSGKIGSFPLIGRRFKKKAFAEVRRNLFGESICFMITGGSEIKSEVLAFFNGIGYHLANGYGMTEIGITSVELGNNDKYLNKGSVGVPFSSVKYKISEVGELLVSGPAIAKYIIEDGVKKNPGEWFNTRDLAEYRDGRYFILGRMDDVVISPSGENLNPNIIEPKFRREEGPLSYAKEVCLVGAKEGETVTPSLVVGVDRYLSKDKFLELDEAIKARISELNYTTAIGRVVYVSDSLIEDNDFKLKRVSIAGKLSRGEYHLMTPGDSYDISELDAEIARKVTEIIAQIMALESETITPESDIFSELACTSLDYFEIVHEIGEHFAVNIPVSQGESLRSVRAFSEYIVSEKY